MVEHCDIARQPVSRGRDDAAEPGKGRADHSEAGERKRNHVRCRKSAATSEPEEQVLGLQCSAYCRFYTWPSPGFARGSIQTIYYACGSALRRGSGARSPSDFGRKRRRGRDRDGQKLNVGAWMQWRHGENLMVLRKRSSRRRTSAKIALCFITKRGETAHSTVFPVQTQRLVHDKGIMVEYSEITSKVNN